MNKIAGGEFVGDREINSNFGASPIWPSCVVRYEPDKKEEEEEEEEEELSSCRAEILSPTTEARGF